MDGLYNFVFCFIFLSGNPSEFHDMRSFYLSESNHN
jgi:hypothetical protein